ncbi:hypothetical protein BN85405120 [Alteracholeplasma palmae J233]|uniref:Rod shape-determining protein MreD n=1 Tax=Alteracholeplasma palmae (strain ATCC 49389 / J233) TaxID=1318466 RepID=U4KK80_ALTPJ|nr:hypothetical protein [Alteracholeplasma palmae]CCV64089.1 hypothetical protein BN85405120 [Alteracholeplasma palmae J233]
MTLKKYRYLDVTIMTVLAIVVDVVSYLVTSYMLKQNFENVYIAPSIVVIIFIYVRWGKIGVISNFLMLMIQFILYRNQIFSTTWFAIAFSVGYLSLASTLIWNRKQKNNILRSNLKTLILYYFVPYSIMVISEIGISYVLGFKGTATSFIIRHIINFILCLVIVVIAKVQKNFMVDMYGYLEKLQKEKDE